MEAEQTRRFVPLVFERYGRKMYARTRAGEWAYGDSQGLYEWRDGELIYYSGGDRQASDREGFWTTSATPGHVRAHQRGRAAALDRRRLS